MPKVEEPLDALNNYLPKEATNAVIAYIKQYKVHLTITRKRRGILGDYRHPSMGMNPRISINGDLNKYEFLITFLHELAHLFTSLQYMGRVAPHGEEWKQHYRQLLQQFLQLQAFPNDIAEAVKIAMVNPSATAGGEIHLLSIIRQYNAPSAVNNTMVQNLADGDFFSTNGKLFQRIEKRRTRIVCQLVNTNKRYLFSAIAEVKKEDFKVV